MAFFTNFPPELLYAIIEYLDLPASISLYDALLDFPLYIHHIRNNSQRRQESALFLPSH